MTNNPFLNKNSQTDLSKAKPKDNPFLHKDSDKKSATVINEKSNDIIDNQEDKLNNNGRFTNRSRNRINSEVPLIAPENADRTNTAQERNEKMDVHNNSNSDEEDTKTVNNIINDRENRKTGNINLTPTEFYCKKYDLIREVADMVLSPKFGNTLIEAISNPDIRTRIEQNSTEDVKQYLMSKGIITQDANLMKEYIRLIFAENLGFGILEYPLKDQEVDEIVVNTHDKIFIEKHGLLELSEYKFPDYDTALGIARKIVQPLNKTLDNAHPNVDGQLPDGSRISATIPPARAYNEISINIRKFPEQVLPLIEYSKKYKSSSPEMVEFLEKSVKAKKNIVISGGTGSGKTTMLNSISYAIDNNERIITIEDSLELRLKQPHVEAYQVVEPNSEGRGGITIQQLIINALRKRPDRIFVGECRGAAIIDFLNAANTGHEGSLTSLHSNSPQESFLRMRNMALQNDETKNMSTEAIDMLLANSIDMIVQTSRLDDGSRKITQITEVVGYGQYGYDKLVKFKQIDPNKTPCNPNMIYLRDIFRFRDVKLIQDVDKNKHVVGYFESPGFIPTFLHEMKRKGITFEKNFFEKRKLMEVD